MQSHNGRICMTFLHCVFLNASSNCMHERMHSYIGCIWMTFLLCAFSNVLSNCLPERMQSHIGCISLAFLHCAFSNVSSDCLSERMQTHIGCIFFTFLHFACMRRHNHIGCTCLTSYQFSSLSQELRYCHSFPDFSPSLPRRKWGEGCVTSALPMHCIVMSRGHWFSRSLFHWNKKSKSEIQCSHSSLTSLHYGEVVMENGNWFTRSFWAKVSLSLSKSLSFA